MPIKSYLAYPVRGQRDALAAALRTLGGCEIVPALNEELLIVVTDTPDETAEDALQEALARLPALQGLALVAGVGEGDIASVPHEEAGHEPT
jgi:hypothetical protein